MFGLLGLSCNAAFGICSGQHRINIHWLLATWKLVAIAAPVAFLASNCCGSASTWQVQLCHTMQC
jgi:hypothetical protein